MAGSTLIWFQDENGVIAQLSDHYYSLSVLMSRLLNEYYRGKRITCINVFLSTAAKYEKKAVPAINTCHYSAGHLQVHGLFEPVEFEQPDQQKHDRYVWEQVYLHLREAAGWIKNDALQMAVEEAYQQGIIINLTPDFRMVEAEISVFGQSITAFVWTYFRQGRMFAKLVLEKEGRIIFEQDIAPTQKKVEFFWESYKSISAEGNTVLLKGARDRDFPALKIPVDQTVLDN